MGLFKNEVGRPSNETIKKRRIIATVIIFAVVLAIGGCVFYTVNYFKGVQGSSKNISSNTSKIHNSISIKNNSGAIYEGANKTNKGNFINGVSKKLEIELSSSNKASLTIRTTYNKDIIKGKLSGVKRYYYQVQIATYDKNNQQISKSNKLDIKETTTTQTITTGTTVAYLRVIFYNATKNHEEIVALREGVWLEAYTKMESIFTDQALRKCVLDTYNKKYNTNVTVLTNKELEKLTSLYCYGKGIKDTKGLERLKGLNDLNLSDNPIETVNLSQNTNLTRLLLDGTKLKSINVTKNTKLETLMVGDNEKYPQYRNNITGLDLSKNTNLKRLDLYKLHIKKLNLTKNTKLEELWATYIGLESIDLSKNTKLTKVDLQHNALKKIDVSKNINLEKLTLSSNNLSSLDVSKNTKLKELFVLKYGNSNLTKAKIKVGNNKNLKIS